MIRVGLIDKHELFRESLEMLIESRVGLEVSISKAKFKNFQKELSPGKIDVLLLDIESVEETEKVALKKVIHQFPEIRVVILTDSVSKNLVMECTEFRVAAFYSKSIGVNELDKAIRDVMNSKNQFRLIIGNDVKERLADEETPQNRENCLFSDREKQILYMVCLEKTNQDIAEMLDISVRTVETHRRRMIERTGSRTMIGVIMCAMSSDIQLPIKFAPLTVFEPKMGKIF